MSRGADWDSKWQLSIDLECNFIWGERGGQSFCQGAVASLPPSSGYATVLVVFLPKQASQLGMVQLSRFDSRLSRGLTKLNLTLAGWYMYF